MRIAVIGASRGLGKELTRHILGQTSAHVVGVARKSELLDVIAGDFPGRFESLSLDLSKEDGHESLIKKLVNFCPDRVFYMAGGGPFGPFHERPFHSHQWAWKVSFEGAARVAHWTLGQSPRPQLVLIGSSIGENRADPGATSYSAAKHALCGLFKSLREEQKDWDLRLFSPGYLDTELLPKGAHVRYKKLWDPKEVASALWHWSNDEKQIGTHKILSDYP